MACFFDTRSGTTPVRVKGRGSLTATKMKTVERAADVERAVEDDFDLHFRVTDAEKFLNSLLPVDEGIVDEILKKMKVKGIYNIKTERWHGFPTQKAGATEKTLYAPFNKVANEIRVAAEEIREKSQISTEIGPTEWLDYHTKSPKSQDSQGAKLRPDGLLALQALAKYAEVRVPSLIEFVAPLTIRKGQERSTIFATHRSIPTN